MRITISSDIEEKQWERVSVANLQENPGCPVFRVDFPWICFPQICFAQILHGFEFPADCAEYARQGISKTHLKITHVIRVLKNPRYPKAKIRVIPKQKAAPKFGTA